MHDAASAMFTEAERLRLYDALRRPGQDVREADLRVLMRWAAEARMWGPDVDLNAFLILKLVLDGELVVTVDGRDVRLWPRHSAPLGSHGSDGEAH